MTDQIDLRVDTRIYGGWTSAQVTSSLETIAGGFTLSLTERWPGQQVRRQVKPGMACAVAINGTPVITGWIDDVSPAYDATSHAVTVRGRDATGDLVDCSALAGAGRWMSANLLTIVGDLCAPFGIKVKSGLADALKTVPEFHLQLGETAFEAIERICRIYAVLPTSDGLGNLVLTRAGEGGAAAELRLGGNIKSGGGTLSDRDRHSRTIILGQSLGGDATDPSLITGCHAESLDPAIGRYRPLVILAEAATGDPTWYQRRADWERSCRAGRSRRYTVTVVGWRDANGALYAPNALVRVEDDWLGLHGSILIAGVTLTQSDQGQLAELSLVHKEAFDLAPPAGLTFEAAK